MDEIKQVKRRSFWGGMLTGVLVVGFVLTLVFVFSIIAVSDKYESEYLEIAKKQAIAVDSSNKVVTQEFADKVEYLYSDICDRFYFEDNINTDSMRDAMYAGVFSALDDKYSEYYTKEEMDALFQETEGVYYGIGSYVTMDTVTGYPYLSGVFDDSPASRAGLRDGDIIYKVNGEDIYGLTLTEVVNLIKGPENTTVDVTIVREGASDYITVTVTRGKVTSPTVTHEMKRNDIAYIQIQEFDDVTEEQFKEAYKDINAQGAKALIIDLRSNGGGNLTTVLAICREILPAGLITYVEDKYGTRDEYRCDGKNEIQIPLVILTNEYTASASELMTGAVRDYQKGTIIGTNTFGKGIVQSIYPLSDGTGYKITTASYFTPKGECIHGYGIAPDIELEYDADLYYDEGVDNQLEYALNYLTDKISK